MKITLNWLKQYVDFGWTPDELSERLTMLGIEVEGVRKIGGEFDGIVVAQVITRHRHPNADKLSLCRVNDGRGERQIVCGADNFKAGDKVPLILPGSTLPARPGQPSFPIKVGKIRGVESHGMMCSPQELGLPDQVDGLLILSQDAPVGQPFAEYLGRAGSDVVYDLEITPNRPDLNSVIGIAREIAAITGNALKLPQVEITEGRNLVDRLVAVRIEDVELCPRYTARVVTGVKVAPSPDWLRTTLEKVGIRSINNVVDVTNYVMLEVGQPLHAFDYRLLTGGATGVPAVVVRRALENEVFVTLDGQERRLSGEILLIADESKPVALAGVMGGQNTEIQPDTTDVLIESAYFKPQNIRATSKCLDLRTESSYRFERGGDPSICEWASRRAAQLILQTAGGELAVGVVDAYPTSVQPKQITVRPQKVNELLGLELSGAEIENYLSQLELFPVIRKPCPVGVERSALEPLTIRVPTYRVDLKREEDLIEEVARLYGVDKIPATPPRGAIGSNEYDAVYDELAAARTILSGLGLCEAQGQTLISDSVAKLAGPTGLVPLANPLSSDMNVLRPSLLPGLLDALRHNLSYKTLDVALFEIGSVFSQTEKGNAEHRRLAIAMTGLRQVAHWAGDSRDAKFDIFDLKGLIEEFFDQYGVRGISFSRRSEMTTLFVESASIHLGKLKIGEIGQLLPTLARQYDLRDAVYLAELDLDTLLLRRNPGKSFKVLPSFPAIRRDVAMTVPEAVTHESVMQVVRQAKPANLEGADLFDVFRGKHVAVGQKSMAYAFTYRHGGRSLTDAEVNAAHDKLVEAFRQKLQAVIRES